MFFFYFGARTNAANVMTNVFYSFRQAVALKINMYTYRFGARVSERKHTAKHEYSVERKLNQKPQFARAPTHIETVRACVCLRARAHVNNINYRQLVHICILMRPVGSLTYALWSRVVRMFSFYKTNKTYLMNEKKKK